MANQLIRVRVNRDIKEKASVVLAADLVIVRTGKRSPHWDDGVIPNIVLRDLGYGQGQS